MYRKKEKLAMRVLKKVEQKKQTGGKTPVETVQPAIADLNSRLKRNRKTDRILLPVTRYPRKHRARV